MSFFFTYPVKYPTIQFLRLDPFQSADRLPNRWFIGAIDRNGSYNRPLKEKTNIRWERVFLSFQPNPQVDDVTSTLTRPTPTCASRETIRAPLFPSGGIYFHRRRFVTFKRRQNWLCNNDNNYNNSFCRENHYKRSFNVAIIRERRL